jgi:hypothetical protein
MLALFSIGFGIVAGLLGLWAAMTEIRNSQDDFIDDLKNQGRRASYAAVCAAASSILVAIDYFMK